MTNADLRTEIAGILATAGIAEAEAEAEAIVRAIGSNDGQGTHLDAREAAHKRASGMPLAYLTGRTTFMGVEVAVSPGALVPRAETELLGRTALDLLDSPALGGSARVIDICCGSGNLACALAVLRPGIQMWASDLTEGAIAVARRNIDSLGIGERVVLTQGDLFAGLETLGLTGTIDLIVCNPPYISTGKLTKERADLLSHEPREAFDGGPYGVSIFQRVIRDAAAFLRPGGYLLFEIGAGQDRQVTSLFARSGHYGEIGVKVDTGHTPRVVMGRRQ